MRKQRTVEADGAPPVSYQSELLKVSKNAGYGGLATVFGILLTYAATLIITRVVGAEVYGVFYLANTVITALTLVSVLGLSQGLLRYVSMYDGRGETGKIKGTILFAVKRACALSLLVAVLTFVLAPVIQTRAESYTGLGFSLQVLAVSLPFLAVMEILIAVLQGLRLVKEQTLTRNVLYNAIRIFFLVVLFFSGFRLDGILWATVCAGVAATAIATFFVYNKFWSGHTTQPKTVDKKGIIQFSIPLFLDNSFARASMVLPVLLLGYFHEAADVGVFGIATRLALVVSLPLTALNLIFAPTISNYYGRGERVALARLFKTVTRWVFTLSLAAGLVVILFSQTILSLFGERFALGSTALFFLVIGEMVNAGAGSVGYMLVMTGRPKIQLWNSFIQFGVVCVLGFLVIPEYGAVGTGLTVGLSIALVNVLRLAQVYYFEKLHPYDTGFLKPVTAGFISFGIISLLRLLFPIGNELGALVYGLIFLIVFTVGLLILRLAEDDLLLLNSLKNKLRLA